MKRSADDRLNPPLSRRSAAKENQHKEAPRSPEAQRNLSINAAAPTHQRIEQAITTLGQLGGEQALGDLSKWPKASEIQLRRSLGVIMQQLGYSDDAAQHGLRLRQLTGQGLPGLFEWRGDPNFFDQLSGLLSAVQSAGPNASDFRVQFGALLGLGVIQALQGQERAARRSLQNAERLAKRHHDSAGETEALLAQGRIGLTLHDLPWSFETGQRALGLAKDHERLQHVISAHMLLASVHEDGDPRRSVHHLQQVLSAQEKARVTELTRQASFLGANTELQLMRQEIEHERDASVNSETQRQNAERALARQSQLLEEARLHDPLCGLPNRKLAAQLIEAAIQQFRRQAKTSSTRTLGLAVLDLDQFSQVNDAYGQAVGDALLQEVTRRIGAQLGPDDQVARSDGDEFMLLLWAHTPGSAELKLRQVLSEIRRDVVVHDQTLIVTASAGLALCGQDGLSAEDLQRAAHTALTHAKTQHSGLECYAGEHAGHHNTLRTEMALARALEHREFQVYYQPLVDAHTHQIVKVEALLRWNSPTFGLLNPSEFIAQLERSGDIIAVGEWILQEACMAAAAHPHWHIAVNLSVRQFTAPDLPGSVERALKRSGLNPQRLELEITESMMMQSCGASATLIERLKDTGARVVIDDFGTGYSSLSHLARCAFNGLKIDKTFVQDITNPRSQAIISAVVQLGHTLNLDVTAEGIETAAQASELKQLGVPILQGYLFGLPQLDFPSDNP